MTTPIRRDMQLLVVVLFDESSVENILLSLTAIGGCHVTILDGVSGTRNLSESIPFFTEFLGITERKISKVLISAVSTQTPAAHLLGVLEEANIHFVKENLGEIFSIPLGEAVIAPEEDDGF